MATLTLSTKLEAVNTIIGAVGESPVNSLGTGTSRPQQVVIAETLLDDALRDIQSEGWHFNTQKKYTINRDVNNKAVLPANTMRVDAHPGYHTDLDIVQRGSTLYDVKNHTDEFTKDLTVDIVFLLQYTEMPEQFRRWATIRAARQMAARFIGSGEMELFTLRDEQDARAKARRSDSDNADHTIFGNYDIAQIIDR